MPSQRVTKFLLNSIYYSGGASFANTHLRGIGSILMLHRVGEQNDAEFSPNRHLTVTPSFLEKILQTLSKSIYEFVSLDEAKERLENYSPTEKQQRPFISLTLDDGYKDNLQNAVPLFRKYNAPYTIYIAPGLVDGRASLWWEDLEHIIQKRSRIDLDMPKGKVEIDIDNAQKKNTAYNDLLHYLSNEVSEVEQRRIIDQLCWLYDVDNQSHRENSIMDWKQLKSLASDPLCHLGAHTIGHYALARLPEKEAIFEVEESRKLVEIETGVRPRHFAYPYGFPAAAGSREFEILKNCGFSTAVTTRHGVCYQDHRNYQTALPRISLNGNFQKLKYVKTLISGATSRLANRGARLNIG